MSRRVAKKIVNAICEDSMGVRWGRDGYYRENQIHVAYRTLRRAPHWWPRWHAVWDGNGWLPRTQWNGRHMESNPRVAAMLASYRG